MKNIFFVFTFLYTIVSAGQVKVNYALVDKIMDAIPSSETNTTELVAKYVNANFKSDSDKIRAIFYWTTSTISYDVKNMFVVNYDQTPEDRIAKTLQTKKGICGDYAAIFNEIATFAGLESLVISGYTKQNGKIDVLSHAWCAAKIDFKWFVFDPTWGSGALINGKFVKKINENYFKVEPSKIIASHIPFDYLWQFLNYPITNAEFYEGKTQINKTKKYFDFEKELGRQKSIPKIDQLFESAERIEKNGLKNSLIVSFYEHQKKQSTVLRENKNIEKLNSIVAQLNEAVRMMNDFIFYRNNKFKPTLPDEEITMMIEKPREILIKCQQEIYTVGTTGAANAANLSSVKKTIETNLKLAEEHASFVKNYRSKSKIARKTMFSKVTWFGIPLN